MFILSAFIAVNISFAQNYNVQQILEKVADHYASSDAYEVEVSYNMYKGLAGNKITESYTGLMIKQGDFSKFQVLNSEIIQFPKVQLVIDNETKQVMYTQNNTDALKNSPLNVKSFLEYFDKTSVVENGNLIVCEMVPTRIISEFPYGKVVLYINKNNYRLEKQELFFSNLLPYVDDDGSRVNDYGRLIINFTHKEAKDKTVNKLSDYISFSSNNEATLTKKYTNYNLIKGAN